MPEPPKRVFTTAELLANKDKYVKVNAAGDGYEGAAGGGGSTTLYNTLAGNENKSDGAATPNYVTEYVASVLPLEWKGYVSQSGSSAPTVVEDSNTTGRTLTPTLSSDGTNDFSFSGSAISLMRIEFTNYGLPYNIFAIAVGGNAMQIYTYANEAARVGTFPTNDLLNGYLTITIIS